MAMMAAVSGSKDSWRGDGGPWRQRTSRAQALTMAAAAPTSDAIGAPWATALPGGGRPDLHQRP